MNTPQTPTPADNPAPQASASQDPMRTYHLVTDTIAGPNIRIKDNVVQTICVAVGTALGALIGYILWVTGVTGANTEVWLPVALGAIGGLILSTLISGGVIMVLGFLRAAKNK